MATTKPRISVTMSHDNYNKLSMYAKAMGMTNSALAAFGLSQYLFSLDKTMSAFESFPEVSSGQMTIEDVLHKMVEDDDDAPKLKPKRAKK